MLRIAVLGVATVAFAAVLAGGAGADEPKPEAGMAGKVTASAGFDKQHGPHSQVECTVTSAARTRTLTATTRSRTTSRTSRSTRSTGAHDRQLERLRDVLRPVLHDVRRGCDLDDQEHARNNPQQTGSDPVTAIDRKHGVAIHSSLNYRSSFRPARRAAAT